MAKKSTKPAFDQAAFDASMKAAMTETNALLVAHGAKPIKDQADLMRRLKRVDLSKALKGLS